MYIFADCCKGYGIEVFSRTNHSLANQSDIYGVFERYENNGRPQHYLHKSKDLYIRFCDLTKWIISPWDECHYENHFIPGAFYETSESCPEMTDGKSWSLNVNGDFQSSTERVRFRCAGEN